MHQLPTSGFLRTRKQLSETKPEFKPVFTTPPILQESGFLRISQIVPGLVPVGKSTWWQWVREGKAPQPVKLSAKTTVWRTADIKAFLEEQGGGNV
ncbi:MAG: hypothetical protein RIR18_1276 [Pseudomonadota bacterium]|jgi:predicted DNA-binding transcriptional regulator AlpA